MTIMNIVACTNRNTHINPRKCIHICTDSNIHIPILYDSFSYIQPDKRI